MRGEKVSEIRFKYSIFQKSVNYDSRSSVLTKFTKILKLLLTAVVRLLIQKMLGKVTGTLQHKDSKKCVNFGVMSNPPSGTCKTGRGAFRWCYDHLMKLDTSNCATVSLETNGRIGASGWCVHMYQDRDVFKVYCRFFPQSAGQNTSTSISIIFFEQTQLSPRGTTYNPVI